jgi:hypothetical protein
MSIGNIESEKGFSRRLLLGGLLVGLVAAPLSISAPSDVEAQERQFTGARHTPRVERPRSHTRGRRRHRRVMGVRRSTPATPAEKPAAQ